VKEYPRQLEHRTKALRTWSPFTFLGKNPKSGSLTDAALPFSILFCEGLGLAFPEAFMTVGFER
jgi:hypothetical protein